MTPHPRWPVVVFDLDGTLVDTIPLILASYRHAYREVLGVEIPVERVRAAIGRPLLETMREASPEHAEELDAVYRAWNLEHLEELVERYAGIPELLDDLAAAGVRTAVVTSKRRPSAERSLAAAGLEGRIGLAATLEDTTEHKPRPEPLLHGCAVLGVDPASVVYVGDAVVDVEAARAAGMASVAVTWGAGEEAELRATAPDHLCTSVAELAALLLAPGR